MSQITHRQFGIQFFTDSSGLKPAKKRSNTSGSTYRSTYAHPNLIFICSDQHSYKDSWYLGRPIVQTANLDRSAEPRRVSTDAYAGSPGCTPGRSCKKTDTPVSDNNSNGNTTVRDREHPTWRSLTSDAGYYIWSAGKMDLENGRDLGFTDGVFRNRHQRNTDITDLFGCSVVSSADEYSQAEGSARGQPTPGCRTNQALKLTDIKGRSTLKLRTLYIGRTEHHQGV